MKKRREGVARWWCRDEEKKRKRSREVGEVGK